MSSLFVLWLGDQPMEKVFTSFRMIIWSNLMNKLSNPTKNRFLMMYEREKNESFWKLLHQCQLISDEDEEQRFLQNIADDQQQTMKELLKQSPLISSDEDQRLFVNIERVEKDYLLKASKDITIRIPDDRRLYDRLYSLKDVLDRMDAKDELEIIHFCDYQFQYQCELFVVLWKILFPHYHHFRQYFLPLAPAVLNDDRPTTKYDEQSLEKYLQEMLTNVVHERTSSSQDIPLAVFKLQLICRKQNSVVHLRSNVETNRDAVFLLYTGARLISILNSYEEKRCTGFYPDRERFVDRLGDVLTSKDEQEFLQWMENFSSRHLQISFDRQSSQIHLQLDKIFQEWILFARRLSPYYSKVRILTENQNHLLRLMFARLELVERLVDLLRRTMALLNLPFIERM